MTARSTATTVIREVGLRDGLQSLQTILPTEQKREWIRAAHAAGLREIEIGSFVPARLLPNAEWTKSDGSRWHHESRL